MLSELSQIFPPDRILTAPEDLVPYSFDGTAALKRMPRAVVFALDATAVCAD
jgi:glycolate oxidase